MFDMEEAKRLLEQLTARSQESEDELLSELVELLQSQLQREKRFNDHLNSQGLPSSITLERFIRHHRGNASQAAAFESYKELVLNYEPSEAEMRAVVEAVYGPHEPAAWELDNARAALIAANKIRA